MKMYKDNCKPIELKLFDNLICSTCVQRKWWLFE